MLDIYERLKLSQTAAGHKYKCQLLSEISLTDLNFMTVSH